jgi:uncharacterized repeat protein (TIGR03943 family)
MRTEIGPPLTFDDAGPAVARKHVSPARVAVAVTVAAWAGLFWFIWLTGRVVFYLGTRTHWVVPLGAIVLTVAFFGRAASLRSARIEGITRRDAAVLAVFLVPVVLLLSLPPAALGAFAVGRRSTFSTGFASTASAEIPPTGDLSMVAVAGALVNRETMKALVGRAGSLVSFTGFVSRESSEPATEFLLNRFVITCCVADAIDTQVRVANVPPGQFKPNEWVRVTGKLYPLGREVIVDASSVTPVKRPHRPYLNP